MKGVNREWKNLDGWNSDVLHFDWVYRVLAKEEDDNDCDCKVGY